jgi:DNA mismatch repair protein MutS2
VGALVWFARIIEWEFPGFSVESCLERLYEAQRILEEARETAEEVYSELDEMRSRLNEEQEADAVNRARSELRRRLNEKEAALRESESLPQAGEEKKSSRALRPGDTVKIRSMGVKAEVLSIDKDGTVSLRAGIMTVSAKEDDLLLLENESVKKKEAPVSSGGTRLMHVPTEIDLRGMESIEAVLAAERYLDSAVMAKLKTVTIIHGKGTGALRDAVRQMLKKNKLVKSYRQGLYGEGEAGVTVVELK